MQGLNNEQQVRQGSNSNNKKIFVIICIYLFLTLTSKYSKNQANNQIVLKNKLLTGSEELSLKEVVSVFEFQEIYQGSWQGREGKEGGSILSEGQGKFQMRASHVVSFNGATRYKLEFNVFNGEYVDRGVLAFALYLDDANFVSARENETLRYFLNVTDGASAQYTLQQILLRVGGGDAKLDSAGLSFSLTERGVLRTEVDVQLLGSSFSLLVEDKQNNLLQIIIFAALLFAVAFSGFTSIMSILKNVYELHDNPRHYSLVTICLTCMWDAALCIIAFVYAFSDQESLMLFIMPAFLLCLLFTNLQPRLMILIYQQSTNSTLREIICRFNLFHYGTLLLVYPILLLTNLAAPLFLFMSCLYFPQIYTNGVSGMRPEYTSPYYTRYLLTRMLIILYLRCFPFNIFHLEPDYLLTALCLILIAAQFGLLYAQKRFGAKSVMPRFLLEPVFDYKLQEVNVEANVEQGQGNECSICLTSLASQPLHDPNELDFQPPFKLMQTPCKHHYHARCLILWMKVKMECPQCRYKLPPFE